MRGLALEGGGARGAYHVGVVKAFIENGYEFDGFVGTSIGAINAALLAQEDFEKALELWMNISMDQIFDVDERNLLRLINLGEVKLDKGLPSRTRTAIAKIIGGRGINTSKMKEFLEKYIDEDKIRESGKDFGLVTVSLNERKAYELLLQDIPQGSLINYIMASASFPGFRPETIDENKFLDGGIYNNLPVNLLIEKGYDEIIAVRTHAPGLLRKAEGNADIKTISARENLGNLLLFTQENSEANIKLGYFDGLREIKHLRGWSYYIEPVCLDDFYARLISIDDGVILEAGKLLDIPAMPAKRMLFEKIIPHLSAYLKLEREFDYADFMIALLEYAAKQKEIDRYQVYGYDRLCELVKNTASPDKEVSLREKIPVSSFMARKKASVEYLAGRLI